MSFIKIITLILILILLTLIVNEINKLKSNISTFQIKLEENKNLINSLIEKNNLLIEYSMCNSIYNRINLLPKSSVKTKQKKTLLNQIDKLQYTIINDINNIK